MKLKEYFNQIKNDIQYTPEETELFTEISNYLKAFADTINEKNQEERLFAYKLLNLQYASYDYRYKLIYGFNPDSKYHSLYTRTYAGQNLSDVLNKYFESNRFEYSHRRKHKFRKYDFNEYTINCLIHYVMAFAIFTTPKLNYIQILLSYFLAVIEFYYVNETDWNYVLKYFTWFIQNVEYEDMMNQVSHLQEEYTEICKNRGDKIRGKKTTHKKKVELDASVFLPYFNKNLTSKEMQKQIAEKYGVSERTVRRFMTKLNLTKNKNSDK